MIPYEELNRALARWKSRSHAPQAEAVHEMVVGDEPSAPSAQAGEIDLEEEVVETYDEAD